MSENTKIRVTVLGSGTSSGVPTISCSCDVCTSDDPKDKRLRSSLLLQSDTTTVLIDTSPDFRQQMLKYNIKKLDAVLYTHAHFDHIGGFDDLRAFNYSTLKPVNLFLNYATLEKIKRTFYYAFEEVEQRGGGIPQVNVHIIDKEEFTVGDITLKPLKLQHGKLEVLGFRINDFAYCTDTNFIPAETLAMLENLDVFIVDALRYTKHTTHYNLDEALEITKKVNPRKTYFTHIAHQIKHADGEAKLPENIYLSYDGLSFFI